MAKKNILYEGKAKILYETADPTQLLVHFKDDATAFNNQKKGTVSGKGVLNNRISEYLMQRLHDIGIATHFIKRVNMREQIVQRVDIIPIEVIVRNVAAGSFCKRLGFEEGAALPRSIVEYCYKDDSLGDPLVSEEHILALGWASPQDLDEMMSISLRVNDFLCGLFAGIGLRLIDFKLEFGRLNDEIGDYRVILADEISPDNMRLWDIKSGEKMDKDRFRRDLGGVEEAYQEVAKRLGLMNNAALQADMDDNKGAE